MPALDHLGRAAEISLTIARRAGSLALSTVRQVADMALERRSKGRSDSWRPAPPDSGGPTSTQPRQAPPAGSAPAVTADPEPAAAAAPASAPAPPDVADHVDREAVLVAESADAGAADGAGAQIRIGEPWKGYASLTAKEVNDRLATAGPAALAVARLYESTNRNRVTVLREIDRRLRAAVS